MLLSLFAIVDELEVYHSHDCAHNCSEKSTKPHDGAQLFLHDAEDDLLGFFHVHLLDACLNDFTDVYALEYAWQMIANDGSVYAHNTFARLFELSFMSFE